MHFLFELLSKKLPTFNKKAHGWDDIEMIAKQKRIYIRIEDYPENIRGFYLINHQYKKPRHVIVLNEKLGKIERVIVGAHELGHFYTTAPVTSYQWHYCKRNAKLSEDKNEYEAHIFSVIFLVPFWLLIEVEESGYADIDPELIPIFKERRKIWERYGI